MYPVWWENERFYKYLAAATRVPGVIPVGAARPLQVHHYGQHLLHGASRLLGSLDRYLGADAGGALRDPSARAGGLERVIRFFSP